jgi:hypothetical protein
MCLVKLSVKNPCSKYGNLVSSFREVNADGCDVPHVYFVNVVQIKVKLSVCFVLTEHHAVKVYWGSVV